MTDDIREEYLIEAQNYLIAMDSDHAKDPVITALWAIVEFQGHKIDALRLMVEDMKNGSA